MGRHVGTVLVCCLAISGLLAGAANARVAQRAGPLTARIAGALAASIRQDAHERGPGAPTEVKVTRRCCGRQSLALYYRAPSERFGGAGQFGVSGGYELQLETEGRSIHAIAISSLASDDVHLRLGASSKALRPFAFSIDHSSRRQGWMSSIGYDYGTFGWASSLPSGARERAPAMAAFREALAVIEKARHHARVTAENPPWPIDALRDGGAYYWGQTEPTSFLWEGTRYPGRAEPIELRLSATGEAVSVRFPNGVHEPLLYCVQDDGPSYTVAASSNHPVPISDDGTFTAMVGEQPGWPVQVVTGRFVGGEVYGTVHTLAPRDCGGTTTFTAIVGGPAG